MKPERWEQIEELFQEALEFEAEERAVWLATACAGDVSLRCEIEALLDSYAEAGSFMEIPAAANILPAITGERVAQIVSMPSTEISESGNNSGAAAPTNFAAEWQIGHYHILSLLGAGGMGEVYLAYDAQLDRQIALKLLPQQFTQDKGVVQRFKREARAASATNHPNIITIYEIGLEAGVHFIATEFVAGQTLRQRITGTQLDLSVAISVTLQIAGALEAAHAAGIVHRDIKPENIMVRPDGLVKVLDFGLAKPIEKRGSGRGGVGEQRDEETGNIPPSPTLPLPLATDPGTLMGTIAYLSPEQVGREQVDHRTDIFSLGIVLYEMITGARPFTGNSAAAIFDAILYQAPNFITNLRPEAPASLMRLIQRTLEKEREARYQTAAELRADLQQIARELDAKSAGATSAANLYPYTRPRWIVCDWKASIILGLLAALAIGLPRLIESQTGRRESGSLWSKARSVRLTDQAGPELFPSLAPNGHSIVYASRTAGNWDIWWQQINEQEGERRLVNLTSNSSADDTQPAFSPDGQWIAFRSERDGGGIFVMSAQGAALRRLIGPGYYYHPAWSPDGRYLYFASERAGSMSLWYVAIDERTGKVLGELERIFTPAVYSQHLSLSRDGRRLAYVQTSLQKNLHRIAFDPRQGKVVGQSTPITQGARWATDLDLSPDGEAIVYSSLGEKQEDLFVIKSDGTGERRPLTNDAAKDRGPRWSPDGKRIAFYSNRSGTFEIWVIDAEGGNLQQLTFYSQSRDGAFYPSWSPGGERLAYTLRGGRPFVIEVDKPWREQTPLPLLGTAETPVVFWPNSWYADGRLLAGWGRSGANTPSNLAIYSLSSRRLATLITRNSAYTGQVGWLHDDHRLLFLYQGKVFLVDSRTRKFHEVLSFAPHKITRFALSGDNRILYFSLEETEADISLLSR